MLRWNAGVNVLWVTRPDPRCGKYKSHSVCSPMGRFCYLRCRIFRPLGIQVKPGDDATSSVLTLLLTAVAVWHPLTNLLCSERKKRCLRPSNIQLNHDPWSSLKGAPRILDWLPNQIKVICATPWTTQETIQSSQKNPQGVRYRKTGCLILYILFLII